MDELSYKDLTDIELDKLKDMYISSRVNSMSEIQLRQFVKEIIIDQIKGTVGNLEEKEAWTEIKEYFSQDLSQKIQEIKDVTSKDKRVESMSPEEIEFNKRLKLLKQQQQDEEEQTISKLTTGVMAQNVFAAFGIAEMTFLALIVVTISG